MASLLTRVKSKMFIRANRKAIHLLDGSYSALVRGRSMDFDDLRSYVSGDEVKDIDWKATARHITPLVKRYIASRRQSLVFVVDSGAKMAALSAAGDKKSELLRLAVGVLGYLAIRHGDEVNAVYSNQAEPKRIAKVSSEGGLERILRELDKTAKVDAKQLPLAELLQFAAKTTVYRSIMVLVTDEVDVTPELENRIRQLGAKHELLWLTISDANPLTTENLSFDILEQLKFPGFLRNDKKIVANFNQKVAEQRAENQRLFLRLGISHQFLESEADTIPALFRMLTRRQYAGV